MISVAISGGQLTLFKCSGADTGCWTAGKKMCTGCFTGDYPAGIPEKEDEDKNMFEEGW